jgi:hypothetical protein
VVEPAQLRAELIRRFEHARQRPREARRRARGAKHNPVTPV